MSVQVDFLPRAKLPDVMRRRAWFIGSRLSSKTPRGFVSPIEPRLKMGIPYDDLREVEEQYFAHRSLRSDLGVLARTALAYAMSPSRNSESRRKPFVVSAHVDNLTIDEALERIFAKPNPVRARMLFFVHAHALNQARFNAPYREILQNADLLMPDGIGIRMAANLLGVALRHNLNGTDLFPILCREAVNRRVPIVLVGGAPGVAASCAERMKAATPGLEIPFVSDGFFKTDADAEAVASQIRKIGPCLVLVGMGSPRQEEWSWKFLRGIAGASVLTVGGLFDFYSGRVRRAPVLWRELGLEWAYRMLQEPRRLAKRYIVGNPLFVTLAMEQKVRGPRV